MEIWEEDQVICDLLVSAALFAITPDSYDILLCSSGYFSFQKMALLFHWSLHGPFPTYSELYCSNKKKNSLVIPSILVGLLTWKFARNDRSGASYASFSVNFMKI